MRFREKFPAPTAKRFWIWLATYKAQARTLLEPARRGHPSPAVTASSAGTWSADPGLPVTGHRQLRFQPSRIPCQLGWGCVSIRAISRMRDGVTAQASTGGRAVAPTHAGAASADQDSKKPRHHNGQLGQRERGEGGL